MKIFLSGVETSLTIKQLEQFPYMKWNLSSFFYIRSHKKEFEYVFKHSEQCLIDSGAFTFMSGTKGDADWEEYTNEYADFIRRYDCSKILGYFEMDIDPIVGYERVLDLRRILERSTDKIIPVWHKNRGIDDFHRMCESHRGKIVAITGRKDVDIRDDQFASFLKTAWKYGCKLHCLAMTRKSMLDKIPFDYVDSTSWVKSAAYGDLSFQGKKIKRGTNHFDVDLMAYLDGMRMQEHYHKKWKGVNND